MQISQLLQHPSTRALPAYLPLQEFVAELDAALCCVLVSTDKDHAAKAGPLMAAGVLKVFSEKASGRNAERLEYKKVIAALEAGDVLLMTG